MSNITEELKDIELGKLIKAVETLTAEVSKLRGEVELIQAKLHTGRGLLIGMFLAAGGVGAFISEFMQKTFR